MGADSEWGDTTAEEAEYVLKVADGQKKRKKADEFPTMEDVKEEIREMATPDLASRIYEMQDRVRYVADHSANLKGTFIKDLRLCAKVTKALGTEMHARTYAPTDVVQLRAQNTTLMRKIADQESTILQLQMTVEEMRSAMMARRQTPAIEVPQPSRDGGVEGGDVVLRKDLQAMEERIMRHLSTVVENLAGKHGTTEQRETPQRKESSNAPRSTDTAATMGHPAKSLNFSECVRRGMNTRPRKGMVTSTPCGTDTEDEGGEWTRVVKRKPPSRRARTIDTGDTTSGAEGPKSPKKRPNKVKKPRVGKVPKSAAISVTLVPGTGTTMAETMKEAREKIDLGGLGIAPGELRPKRAITGAMILEVIGEENTRKATALAESMRSLFQDKGGVKIAVPQKMSEVRVSRIDESVTQEEIVAAIASNGGCDPADVRVGNIKFSPYGMGTAWVRCPVAAAKKIVALERLMVGWSATMVSPLEARPLQCYQCLEFGHVRVRCPKAEESTPQKCFKCGQEGHFLAECQEEKHSCPLCKTRGYECNHRMGGGYCRSLQETRRRKDPTTPARTGTVPADTTATATTTTTTTTTMAGQQPESTTAFKKPTAPALKAKKKAAPAGASGKPPAPGGDRAMEVDA